MTRFSHKDAILILNEGKGKLYINGSLRFMGDGYVAIKFLLEYSGNNPAVKKRFQAQLSMREKPKFTDSKKAKEEHERSKEELKATKEKRNKVRSQWDRMTK